MSLFSTIIEGFEHHQNYLPIERQNVLLEACRTVIRQNPLFTPINKQKGFEVPFALKNTNCGKFAWFPYFYAVENLDGSFLPPIPNAILEVVSEFTDKNFIAENCLINYYEDTRIDGKRKLSHLGLHRDKSERNLKPPIISISLGLSCVFQIGGLNADDEINEVVLKSGDVIVMGGKSRNAFHGVKAIVPATMPEGLEMKSDARINITVRQVD